MFVMFEKGGRKHLVLVVEARETDGVDLYSPANDNPHNRGVSIANVPGFTMTDLVQPMNAASQRGDCVAVLQSYRPKGAA